MCIGKRDYEEKRIFVPLSSNPYDFDGWHKKLWSIRVWQEIIKVIR
jgi:hypothetical protein